MDWGNSKTFNRKKKKSDLNFFLEYHYSKNAERKQEIPLKNATNIFGFFFFFFPISRYIIV